MKLPQSQNHLPELQIFKERLEVGAYSLDQIVIHRSRNVVTEEGGSPAVFEISGPTVEEVFFNRMGQGGGQGVFMILVGLIILEKHLFADIMTGVD